MEITKVNQITDSLKKYTYSGKDSDYITLTEWANGEGYDIDINGKLIRVQCKTSHEIDLGVIEFSCRSCRSNTQSNLRRRYTVDEVDYFCTYWNNMCYLVPINECSVSKKLRFIPPKNNQKVGISYAKDYELPNQINLIKD